MAEMVLEMDLGMALEMPMVMVMGMKSELDPWQIGSALPHAFAGVGVVRGQNG